MSENLEKTVSAEEISAADNFSDVSSEVELDLEDLGAEQADPEVDMTMGEKLKVLLMKPLWSSIVKWVFVGLGIVGLVLYLVASESLAKAFSGVSGAIASFFSLFPISMFEILICAAVLGIIAYLVFIIVRTVQVKGAFHKGGLWVQFGYSLLAVAGAFAILMSMCYGVFTYREPLSKSTDYTNAKVTNLNFSKTMLYLIDGINNSLYEGMDNIYFNKAGSSKYASSGRSTEAISKKISEAFDNAAQDIPTLKGKALNAKELIFSDVYSKFRISSIYSPFTGELCINTDYPEVVIPMQIAKTMAVQRGYTDDGDASFIAFLVCTKYSDDYYIRYSGYFNAYVEFSSVFYNENGKNLHLYMANALKESAKREYVQLVKKLDTLYGLSSDLEYVAASEKLQASDYCNVAKLMLVNFEDNVDAGSIAIDESEPKSYGRFCNYLVNYYLLDDDFRSSVEDVYAEYHPGSAN